MRTICSNNLFTNEINGDKYIILREYDSFGRISKEKIYSGELINGEPSYPYISKEYSYYAHGSDFTESLPIILEEPNETDIKMSEYSNLIRAALNKNNAANQSSNQSEKALMFLLD